MFKKIDIKGNTEDFVFKMSQIANIQVSLCSSFSSRRPHQRHEERLLDHPG